MKLTRILAVGMAVAAPAASAQQIIEIDLEAGRTIIDDEWRSMYTGLIAVDWDRDILYVEDDEEPEGIMTFSTETGEWIRTIPTPEGDGTLEFPQGARGMDIAPRGGLYVSGFIFDMVLPPILARPRGTGRSDLDSARAGGNPRGAVR